MEAPNSLTALLLLDSRPGRAGPASSHSPAHLVLKEVELRALHCDAWGCLSAPAEQTLCEGHTVSPRPPRVGLTGIRIPEPRVRGLFFGG